jgi:hypothetical protein
MENTELKFFLHELRASVVKNNYNGDMESTELEFFLHELRASVVIK